VYLNSEVREELEAEGYAREITRQIQQLRKEAKLEKSDRVRVVLRMSSGLQQKVSVFAKEMKSKVGADTLTINPSIISSASFSAQVTIKKEVVEIAMTVVK
jgi:isoleucyl-tRNA synthetase